MLNDTITIQAAPFFFWYGVLFGITLIVAASYIWYGIKMLAKALAKKKAVRNE